MSRVLPILFNADMVRAILDGRKAVTRRLMKPNPPCQPGDVLYVRETWQECCRNTVHSPIVHSEYCFKASLDSAYYGCIEECGNICKWHPSIHMPKEAARIFLRVTDVRAERLQEITAEQIIKEGANQETIRHYIAQMPEETEEWIEAAHKLEWQQLWDSTIKKPDLDRYGWEANPWVWVIEFERCKKPEA